MLLRRWIGVLSVAVVTLLGGRSVVAQAVVQSAAPERGGADRTVDGRVRRPVGKGGDSTGLGPAIGAWVTVHRVAKDSAGPIDSVRTDRAGRYRMAWRAFGSADAVYFASVSWDGIAYFTPPLRSANSRADEAEITVFDTTSRTFPVSVRGRHLIVGKVDSADMRTVIEVFELSNDSVRTLVSPAGPTPTPTWSTAIPAAARDVQSTDGEISPDAFAAGAGRVSVFAPLAPGIKQLSFSYKVPARDFPLTFSAVQGAMVFEVLVEDPRGTVTAPGFTNVEPVTLEQRNFRRYVAQDVGEGTQVRVDLPLAAAGGNRYMAVLLIAIGALMVLVLLRAMRRRGRAAKSAARAAGVHRRAPEPSEHEQLAQEIAVLDARFALEVSPSDEARRDYARRRSQLKDSLAAALQGVLATGITAG